jgi:hypothetical protein
MIIYNTMTYLSPKHGELRIRPGYVYIKKSEDLPKGIENVEGAVHGQLFYDLFGKHANEMKADNILTSGFAKLGIWKFNSHTLNKGTQEYYN